VIFGVSVDRPDALRRFRDKENIRFDFLSDPDGKLCRAFGVRVTNLLIAKFAERVTFLIGEDGKVREAFSSVSPKGHAAQVLRHIPPCPLP
jgi:peroxiredoxin Q/BCP